MERTESVDKYLEQVFRYHDDVYRIIINVVRDHYTAEELTQIVMVKAWNSFHTLRNPDSSKAWVKKIARNVLGEHMRKKKSYLSHADRRTFSKLEAMELRSIELDIVEAIIKKEQIEIVFKSLDMLDNKYSDIIREHVFGGFTLKSIAKSTRMNYGTVREYYSRGMRKLRDIYRKVEKGGYC